MSDTKPKELFEAIGELAMAISPHYMDQRQRGRVAEALSVLIDHVITFSKAPDHGDTNG